MSDEAPQVQRFQGAGLTLVGDVVGPADGVPVVFLHGGGQTRAAWGRAILEGARRGFRAISLDLRGHGESDWSPEGDYSIDARVADLAGVVASLGQAPFLVGASLGGITALVYAGEGGRTRGVALVDVAHRVDPVGVSRIRDFMTAKPEGFASLEEAADAVAAYLHHRPRPADVSGLARNLRLGEDGRYHWHWDRKMMTNHRVLEPERMAEAARNLTVPTLLVRGGRSDVISPEIVREFLTLAPHAEFVDIAGAHHMVAGDRNDAFNDAVFSFLERWRKAG